MLSKIRDFDFYRNIPKDLTETSTHGAALSICASIFMVTLFIAELWAFLAVQYTTNTVIDNNANDLLPIFFNISVLNVPCEYAQIDIVDVLGTRNESIKKGINRWSIAEDGRILKYEGDENSKRHKDIDHDNHHDHDALIANGVHARVVEDHTFSSWVNPQVEYAFVNFYAPWCIWCQRLEPVWEAFAEEVERHHDEILKGVSIIKVDCVTNRETCAKQHILGFPTVRLFVKGEPQTPDYRGDRTVDAFMQYLEDQHIYQKKIDTLPINERIQLDYRQTLDASKKGCLLEGYMFVNRVPGNFHIEARSEYHNLNPSLANLSHIVNHLSMGHPLDSYQSKQMMKLPEELFRIESTHPINNHMFRTKELHQAYHHYLKVISTHLDKGRGRMNPLAYQIITASQVMKYEESEIPEARFSYDLSPMAVVFNPKKKHWYEFITSICALIGGTFTVVGLLSSFLGIVFKNKKL